MNGDSSVEKTSILTKYVRDEFNNVSNNNWIRFSY